MGLNLSPLDALQIKRFVDFLVEEEVLHDEQISLRLHGSCLEILDFDRVKPKYFAKNRRFARCRVHVSKIRRRKIQ